MRNRKVISEVLGETEALTPSDILNTRFRRAFWGGYDLDEVNEFLATMADQVEALIQEIRSLQKQQEERQARLDDYRQMESTLRNALVSSQKFGDEILEAAKREAQVIVGEARLEKERARIDAARIPDEIAKEIAGLEHQRDRLRKELHALIESHRTLLDLTRSEGHFSAPKSAGNDAEPVSAAEEGDASADARADDVQTGEFQTNGNREETEA